MSVAGYLGKSVGGAEVDRKDRTGVKETERVYEGVAGYDAVLRSHCGLDAAGPPLWENWVRAARSRRFYSGADGPGIQGSVDLGVASRRQRNASAIPRIKCCR